MSIFSQITVRANGDRVFAAWWNDIRAAMVAFFGAGAIEETEFTLPDASPAVDVTGLFFDGVLFRTANVTYDITRPDGGGVVRANGTLVLFFDAGVWTISTKEESGDEVGVTFTIVTVANVGQIQVATTNLSGAGKLNYRAGTWDV